MWTFELRQRVLSKTRGYWSAQQRVLVRFALSLSRHISITAALAGMVLPWNGHAAAEGLPSSRNTVLHASSSVVDVRLSDGGVLAGRVVDGAGRPGNGVSVTVLHGGQPVGSVATGADGRFSVCGLRGGVHQLVAGEAQCPVRLWTMAAAPPAAVSKIMLVDAGDMVRGQLEPGPLGRGYEKAKYWLADPFVVAGIVAVAVAIPVAVHNANKDRDSGS